MEVTLAKSAGFCFGVKRAVDMVYQEAGKPQKVYTLGPIIHNEQVVADLEAKGVHVLQEDLSDLEDGEDVTVIIRSHGISKQLYQKLEQLNVTVVDATCPFVSKIHRIVEKQYQAGDQIVIVGNANHPEVKGTNSWCDNTAIVVGTLEEAENCALDGAGKITIVSQTTFNYKKFKDIVEIFFKKSYDINVMNTICNATEERQTEAAVIAGASEAMIVIGGKHSSNTRKLYEICSQECPNTHFIQTLDDLDLKAFQFIRSVGITAGASTPNTIIKEVQSYVRDEQ